MEFNNLPAITWKDAYGMLETPNQKARLLEHLWSHIEDLEVDQAEEALCLIGSADYLMEWADHSGVRTCSSIHKLVITNKYVSDWTPSELLYMWKTLFNENGTNDEIEKTYEFLQEFKGIDLINGTDWLSLSEEKKADIIRLIFTKFKKHFDKDLTEHLDMFVMMTTEGTEENGEATIRARNAKFFMTGLILSVLVTSRTLERVSGIRSSIESLLESAFQPPKDDRKIH